MLICVIYNNNIYLYNNIIFMIVMLLSFEKKNPLMDKFYSFYINPVVYLVVDRYLLTINNIITINIW